jgi:hypothetical protein
MAMTAPGLIECKYVFTKNIDIEFYILKISVSTGKPKLTPVKTYCNSKQA